MRHIMELIGARFRCFGGGDVRTDNNPMALALKDRAMTFAAGVDVEEVVRFVITHVRWVPPRLHPSHDWTADRDDFNNPAVVCARCTVVSHVPEAAEECAAE